MAPTPDLTASCWTTAGDAAPARGDELSPVPLRERIEAAAAAGFRGFGLVHADLVVAARQHGLAEVRTMLEAHGMVHVELEFLLDWWTSGPRREASDQVRRDLLAASEALAAKHIKAGPEIGPRGWEQGLWEQELARLAAEAEAVGARVSLEFLPMCNVATLADALAIVRGAGHPAAGVLVDAWHAARTGLDLEELAAVPAAEIAAIELDDVDPDPAGSLWDDTIDGRRLPGQGGYDVPAFINAVRATGWNGPWGLEILSAVERVRPIREALVDAHAATVAQFELADERSTL
jgi:sugar phosphate isomerase/epimerase